MASNETKCFHRIRCSEFVSWALESRDAKAGSHALLRTASRGTNHPIRVEIPENAKGSGRTSKLLVQWFKINAARGLWLVWNFLLIKEPHGQRSFYHMLEQVILLRIYTADGLGASG